MLYLNDSESAVSPVIGIMLMLVVTIIIAAVVSGFAGGMMQNKEVAPQASVSGSFSQYNGLTMTHTGGDAIETRDVRIIVRPSDEFGRGQSEYGQLLVNQSCITDVYGNRWINPNDGTYGVMSWRPGESMYILGGEDLIKSGLIGREDNWPPCYNTALEGGKSQTDTRPYCHVTALTNQINIGKTITLEIIQSDGQMIASADVVIQS